MTIVGNTSKPNERSCRILLKKKGAFPPPCDPFCFLGKKHFFGFSEKISKCFFNEIDCKKFSNFFCNEFSSKKFFKSLKLNIKNFRIFFCNEFIAKKIRKFFTANFIEKTFRNFFRKSEKKIFAKKQNARPWG